MTGSILLYGAACGLVSIGVFVLFCWLIEKIRAHRALKKLREEFLHSMLRWNRTIQVLSESTHPTFACCAVAPLGDDNDRPVYCTLPQGHPSCHFGGGQSWHGRELYKDPYKKEEWNG